MQHDSARMSWIPVITWSSKTFLPKALADLRTIKNDWMWNKLSSVLWLLFLSDFPQPRLHSSGTSKHQKKEWKKKLSSVNLTVLHNFIVKLSSNSNVQLIVTQKKPGVRESLLKWKKMCWGADRNHLSTPLCDVQLIQKEKGLSSKTSVEHRRQIEMVSV